VVAQLDRGLTEQPWQSHEVSGYLEGERAHQQRFRAADVLKAARRLVRKGVAVAGSVASASVRQSSSSCHRLSRCLPASGGKVAVSLARRLVSTDCRGASALLKGASSAWPRRYVTGALSGGAEVLEIRLESQGIAQQAEDR